MTEQPFPHLFRPLRLRGTTLRNRIMSSGHDTTLPTDGTVNDALIAYHTARARGGAGLIVTQVAGVHETARYTAHLLMATDDGCIPGYARLARAVHAEGAAIVSQLFHPGREIMESADGLLPVAWSADAVPNERFHVMPRRLDQPMIDAIVAGYGAAARRTAAAGLDGVELVASHGYLPAQFLNPRVNRRSDGYGGDDAGRLRFPREVLERIRAEVPENFIVGLRISMDERDEAGLERDQALAACRALAPLVDYISLTLGTSASLGGAIHIAPPMTYPAAYVAAEGLAAFRAAVDLPLFITGRINQPHEAEAILARGEADVCGLTRALICDPRMPAKAQAGRTDDIRACIGCNQACIGHFHRGLPISCIQHPETGRELLYDTLPPAAAPRQVLVIGGGPAGLKAAAVAAARGHRVTLLEAGPQPGGQALLAQLLPRRAEFGGIVTNLMREAEAAGVTIRRNTRADAAAVRALAPDAVVLATGALPHVPPFETDGAMQVLTAWDLLLRRARPGGRVLVVDWRCDWIGPGLAELLRREGCAVDLAVNGLHAGQALPLYVRDDIAARLHALEVPVTPYLRLYGTDGDSVVMQHTASGLPVMFEGVDTLVLATGHRPDDDLRAELDGVCPEIHMIGDCLAPRTAEEAVFEGLRIGCQV